MVHHDDHHQANFKLKMDGFRYTVCMNNRTNPVHRLYTVYGRTFRAQITGIAQSVGEDTERILYLGGERNQFA